VPREHRKAGRPRGASAKAKACRDEIARGADPEATFQKYYGAEWKRAMKRHAPLLETPETEGDPKAVLENVALYGSAADKIQACGALLSLLPATPKRRSAAITIVDVTDRADQLPPDANVYDIPSELDGALAAFDRLLAGKIETTPNNARELSVSPLRILAQIIAEARDKDAELVRAAKLLLQQHAPSNSSSPRAVYVLPDSGRIPVANLVREAGDGWGVILVRGEDAKKVFWRACTARWDEAQPVKECHVA